MENATKALLIAAAVLIVIMIIGIALKISNSANGTINQAQTTMSAIEIQTFNARFTPYIGNNISHNRIIELEYMILQMLSDGNKNIKFTIIWNRSIKDQYSNKSTVADLNKTINQTLTRNNNFKYKVTVEYDTNGLINAITAEKM